jgi:hypothetical protein
VLPDGIGPVEGGDVAGLGDDAHVGDPEEAGHSTPSRVKPRPAGPLLRLAHGVEGDLDEFRPARSCSSGMMSTTWP